MTARLTHKRLSTLRWVCRRTTDPVPGSAEDPHPIAVTIGQIAVALRRDDRAFYEELEVKDPPDGFSTADGYFTVYAPATDQEDWPLGDCFFDFKFFSPSMTPGEETDVAATETAILHIQKEGTE